jgi:hypothetical protein
MLQIYFLVDTRNRGVEVDLGARCPRIAVMWTLRSALSVALIEA